MPQWRAPLRFSTDRQTPRYAKSPSRSSSSLRVLRRQGAAKHKLARRQAAKLCYRFGPLTPFCALHEPDRSDGTRTAFPLRNKEPTTNQKYGLTGKAPYRFESCSLQQTVGLSLDFSFLYPKAGSCRGVCGPKSHPRLTFWNRELLEDESPCPGFLGFGCTACDPSRGPGCPGDGNATPSGNPTTE